MKVLEERDAAHVGTKTATFRTDDIANSAEYRKAYEFAASVVLPEDQPFERSPDGLIKHLVHEKMNTREHCVDAYMQFIEPGDDLLNGDGGIESAPLDRPIPAVRKPRVLGAAGGVGVLTDHPALTGGPLPLDHTVPIQGVGIQVISHSVSTIP